MIHYTLLPERERNALKKEYRTRLMIFLFFFLSTSVFIGTMSLIPAYLFSSAKEKESLTRLNSFEKSREERGTSALIKELAENNVIVKKLKDNQNTIVFSDTIFQIIGYKPKDLSIKSFNIESIGTVASSTVTVVLQGKAPTRESLLEFKAALETEPTISEVELPVSDLAKSKDISYSLKITIKTKL